LHRKIANRRIVAGCGLAQTILNLSIHIAPTQILDIRFHLQRNLHGTALRKLFPFSMRLLIRAAFAPCANTRAPMSHFWWRQCGT
jgi:hypothetical protein